MPCQLEQVLSCIRAEQVNRELVYVFEGSIGNSDVPRQGCNKGGEILSLQEALATTKELG